MLPLIAVVTMGLEQAAPAVGQGHGMVTTIHGNALNQPLLSQMTKVGVAPVHGGIPHVAEIALRDDAKGAHGGERPALRSAQAILATAITHELAFRTARQIQIAREHIAWIPSVRVVVAIAFAHTAVFAAVPMRSAGLGIVALAMRV